MRLDMLFKKYIITARRVLSFIIDYNQHRMQHYTSFKASGIALCLSIAFTASATEVNVYDPSDFSYTGVGEVWGQIFNNDEKLGARYQEAYSTLPSSDIFNIKNKPINIGTLDYLQELGEWMKGLSDPNATYNRWGSIYSLGSEPILTGDAVNTEEITDNQLLRYAISETTLWCDRENGDLYTEKREGKNDIEIKIKDLLPMLYEFDFKKTTFGNKTPGSTQKYIENFDYVIGTRSDISYYVPESSEQRQANATPANGVIEGVFSGLVSANRGAAGAIYNSKNSSIKAIRADFFDCGYTSDYGGGGAISNWSNNTISGGIYGTFIGNYAKKEGGAIWNYDNSYISVIDGDFIGNYIGEKEVQTADLKSVRGGAIYNYYYSKIGTITGNFIGNIAYGHGSGYGDGSVGGAAISNGTNAHINMIVADFIGNTVLVHDLNGADGHGAAIYNGGNSTINYVIGDFYGNSIDTPKLRNGSEESINWVKGHGAAICNSGLSEGSQRKPEIEIADRYNEGKSLNFCAAIYNIEGAFVRNYVRTATSSVGGVIYNDRNSYIGSIRANFVRNFSKSVWTKGEADAISKFDELGAAGGAIYNSGAVAGQMASRIDEIEGNFYGNYTQTHGGESYGGAIANQDGEAFIGTITGNFIGNYSKSVTNRARGGAIYTSANSIIKYIKGSFYDNYTWSDGGYARGGAIANGGALEVIENAVFENNYAVGHDADNVHGGAIYNMGTLEIRADGAASLFRGNYTAVVDAATGKIDEKSISYEAIYGSGGSVISFVAINDGAIVIDDIINGDREGEDGAKDEKGKPLVGHTIYVQGHDAENPTPDSSGVVVFNNSVKNADIYLEDVSLVIHSEPTNDTENDLDKQVGRTTYTPEEWRRNVLMEVDGKKGKYSRSTILRQSPLFARSGQVILADGNVTDYIFSIVEAKGPEEIFKEQNISAEEAKKDGTFDKIMEERNYATFTVDVDLDRGVADLITVFGITSDGGKTWTATPNREGRFSVSKGHVALNLSFIINNNSYDAENSYIPERDITVQVLNFVMMDGEQGTLYDDEDLYEKFRSCPEYYDQIIQLSEYYRHMKHAKSYMDSSDIVAEDTELTTTKTHNDSIIIRGYRDPLAAWAELRESDNYKDEGTWSSSSRGEKVFEVLEGGSRLTRNIVDKDSADPVTGSCKESSTMTGSDLTIFGSSTADGVCVLNVDGHNLLQEVGSGQRVELRYFNLKGVPSILNNGSLILDTMRIHAYDKGDGAQPRLMLNNEASLTIRGNTIIREDNTITSAEAQGDHQLVIEDGSAVNDGKTNVTILGVVENQNIVHKGSGTRDKDDFTTVTNLIVTETPSALAKALRSSEPEDEDTPTQAYRSFRNNSLDMEGGKFNLGVLGGNVLHLRSLSISGGTIYAASSTVNLATATMGGIRADQASGTAGEIYLGGMKLLNDSKDDVIHVQFVNEEVGDLVKDNGIRNSKMKGAVHYYDVTYNDTEKTDSQGQTGKSGWYTFSRIRDEVVPEVQTSAVAQLGGYASMMQVYDYSFEHADLFSSTMANTLSNARRERYAENVIVTPVKGYKGGGAVASAVSPCPVNKAGMQRALWLRPYATYEKLPLDNGPKVRTNLYGALFGGDSSLREHRGGWASVTSVYGVYTGATKRYEGIRSRENGMGIGATETLYKGNFYTALTAAVNASFGSTRTADGHEKYDMLMGGIASRTGYNLTLGNCRYVLQPTLLMSYTMVDVGNYTNASGVRMKSSPLHVFQLHPYVKAIRHTDSGWDPYITVGYVHNFLGRTKIRANEERLPSLSIDPYVEYSLGLQKTWLDRYTLYTQATGRHGGRNGAELSVGLRWIW